MKLKGNKYLKKLTIAVLLSLSINQHSALADDEETINLPAQVMIMSLEEWNNRNLRIIGSGGSNIVIYGGKQEGRVVNSSMDESTTFINFYGGYYDGINSNEVVDVTDNVIDIRNGSVSWIVYDDPDKYDDSYNRTHIYGKNGKTLNINVIGGHSGLGEVSGNTINFYGGKVNGYIIAAETKTDTADNAAIRLHDNVVNIFANSSLREAKIYGAALYNDEDRNRSPIMGTNNTLNIYVKDVNVSEMTDFNNLNFYLPQNTVNGDLVLNVTSSANTNIAGSKVIAIVDSDTYLDLNDKVILIQNNKGKISDDEITSYKGIHSDTGSSEGYTRMMEYHLVVEKVDDSHVILRLVGDRPRTPTEFVPQVRVPTIINRGGDLLAGSGLSEAESAGAQIYTPFFAATQSSMRQKTGSYVETVGTSMILGVSRKLDNEKRRRLVAPIVEYGLGRYDSYADGGVHGRGNNHYIGGGIVFRDKLNDGSYYEGSIRAGRLKVDYETNAYPFKNQYLHEDFDTSSHYIGAHFGVGRELPCKVKDKINYYSKFFYTYIGPDQIHLTTGEEFKLSQVHSNRLRLGTRYSYQADEKNKLYIGTAYEYEFKGSSYATYEGFKTKTASIRGGSGMIELGWVYKPESNDRWSFDLSGVGWVGRQQGLTGRFGINWMF
ncbi:MAG: hypothetical protein IJ797_10855 [Selenomonadaceae bacterium]|nr:hypothetical protein [Selenomonadaceae bacterium]